MYSSPKSVSNRNYMPWLQAKEPNLMVRTYKFFQIYEVLALPL